MRKLTILILLFPVLAFPQKNLNTIVISDELGTPLRNVNVVIKKTDTVLLTDAFGVVDLSSYAVTDSIIIKKFGYIKGVVVDSTYDITLKKDSSIYSHNLKLIDRKFSNKGEPVFKIRINGEDYWFKQESEPLYLGNGRALETKEEYEYIFINHNILKTISVNPDECLYGSGGMRGENRADWIVAIYYTPQNNLIKSNDIPQKTWKNREEIERTNKIMKEQSGCLE